MHGQDTPLKTNHYNGSIKLKVAISLKIMTYTEKHMLCHVHVLKGIF